MATIPNTSTPPTIPKIGDNPLMGGLGAVYGVLILEPHTRHAASVRLNSEGAAVVTYEAAEGTTNADRALDAVTAWENRLTYPARTEEPTRNGHRVQVHGTIGGVWVVVQALIVPPVPVPGDPGDWLDGPAPTAT